MAHIPAPDAPQAPDPDRKQGLPGWVIALIVAVVGLPVLVAALGVFASLAIYGVRKNLLSAKSAEAKEGIGRIAKDAASAYDREQIDELHPHRLCSSASASVPDSASKIMGRKYQSSPSEWTADANGGFACLKFSMRDPQYYMYSYEMSGAGQAGSTFEATANGDLNGDGFTSEFMLSGRVSGTSVIVSPTIKETLPGE